MHTPFTAITAQPAQPRALWQRLIVGALLACTLLVQTGQVLAQYQNFGQNSTQNNGQASTGYTPPSTGAQSGYNPDGTLYMGGTRIGNPHQILHDAQIPSFMTITATRYTYTDNPNHGQGTLLQMAQATTAGSDSSVLFNRLYLSPTNPYVQGAPGPYPNYQTYQGVLQNAQQANFLLTNADDGKTYAFKTLTAASRQAADLLIRELPNTQQFRDNADPLGGGVGVRVTQNGDAVALAAYLATVKPYDYSWQPNYGNTFGTTFGQNGGQNPYSGWANSNNFAPDYSEGAGPAQSFQAFIKQLQDDAVANDKKVRSQTSANSLDLSSVNPNSLFGEGYNLFQYGSNSNPNRDLENDFLKRLQSGLLTVGSADYLEASRIAQERYRIAYGIRLETGKPLQFTVAQAQQKANELKLDAINPNELFGQGFDLFKYNSALRANGEAENVLLARLQNGELTPGSADYLQATQIAQERLRVAYSQSLSPPEPKKVSKWKLIVGVVVGAVLTFVTAGAAAPFVASALTGVSVAAASAALTAGFFAGTVMGSVITAIAGVVAGAVGALASATITTGKLSEGFKAAGNALVSGSVKALVGAAIGLSFASLDLLGTAGTVTETVSNIAANTLSGAISQTILGGGSFADNLKTSAISSVVDAVGKSAANTIGDAFPNTDGKNLANYAAHGVLGCASAAAKGADCAAGAVGAVAGEAAAATGFLDAAANSTIGRNLNKDEVIFFGGLVGGTAAAVASKAEDVNANFATGTATASNAVANNYLNHTQWKLLADKLNSCSTEAECTQLRKEFTDLSAQQDRAMQESCKDLSSAACKSHVASALEGTKTQINLAQTGALPASYLAGSDLNASANLTAKNMLVANLQASCSGNVSCEQKSLAGYKNLASTMLDFVPLIGDMKGFIEAQSPFDYMLAAVGTLGPVGDGVKLMLKEAKLLAEAGDTAKAAEKLNQVKGDLHHICTNKNCISTASGGPWTPEYTKIFDGAGLDINKSLDNLVNVPGHKGPHPQAYHEYVYKQLDDATTGLSKGTQAYTDAVKAALAKLKIEATTPSNQVNNWLTKK
jgi:A nuclease family of the HNH/ENDO VII superfamily with conserved AHH/Possible hemagglutinin (DUF637)/Pre-toxin domain with VENN motif